FFKAPYYNLTVALYSETTKSPFAILEALTAEVGPLNFPIPAFTGPVLLISGEYDFIFCAGYCPGVLHEPAASVFHASRNFESYVQPGMSHGMNFHYNATGFYGVVTGFLSENGF
ncbi:hypothetical protein MMC08_008676, partial [Hypocenomyce scalaris]|nr:hypothetical protein [Hypocenomyce scalaris]